MGRGHPFCNSPQKIKLRPLALQPSTKLHLPAVGGAGGQRKEPTAPAGSHRLFLCITLRPQIRNCNARACITSLSLAGQFNKIPVVVQLHEKRTGEWLIPLTGPLFYLNVATAQNVVLFCSIYCIP